MNEEKESLIAKQEYRHRKIGILITIIIILFLIGAIAGAIDLYLYNYTDITKSPGAFYGSLSIFGTSLIIGGCFSIFLIIYRTR